MKDVFVYGFRGRFDGNAEYEYRQPQVGDTHHCMLFIAHDHPEPDLEHAATVAQRYGFVELKELRGGKLQPEVLKTDAYKGFSCFHQQALDEGTSIIYYPNHED